MGSVKDIVSMDLPSTMKAIRYRAPQDFAVVELPLPELQDSEVLVKISACGVCGTDLHFHNGEFLAKFPLIPGHEATGTVVARGSNTPTTLPLGTRVVIDPLQPCHSCFHCQHDKPLLCERITGYGSNRPGGFAEYTAYPAQLVHAIPASLSALEAVLLEPAACALHGIERMAPAPGSRALLFGCGPTGLLLAQMLKMNGVAHPLSARKLMSGTRQLTIVSKAGPKLARARAMGLADAYVEVAEAEPERAMEGLAEAEPYGWDLVVEATGATAVLERALGFVRKGGKLAVYGVYGEAARVSWAPMRIWENEITVLASFCSVNKFPAVLEYVRAGRLRLEGIVDRTFGLDGWGEALQAVRDGEMVKGAVVF